MVRDYTDGRLARRAEQRVRVLREGIGASAEFAAPFGEYQRIRTEYGEGRQQQAMRKMEVLVKKHPNAPFAAEGESWLGSAYRHDGQLDLALSWYRAAAHHAGNRETRWRARKGEADTLAALVRLDEAEAIYRALLAEGGDDDWEAQVKTVEYALIELEAERRRARGTVWAWAALGVLALAMLGLTWWASGDRRAFLNALVRFPTELVYLAPVALLWIVLAPRF